MKKLFFSAFVLIPMLGLSQDNKCEFERFKNNSRINFKTSFHSLNTTTTINYYEDGYEVRLETIFEDNSLNYYIEIYKKGVFIAEFDLWSTKSQLG